MKQLSGEANNNSYMRTKKINSAGCIDYLAYSESSLPALYYGNKNFQALQYRQNM